MRKKDSWSRIQQDLSEKLREHTYTFIEVWSIVGCGEKTLRRYMDRLLVRPLKHLDEWLFTPQMLDKVSFIHKCKNKFAIPVNTGAGLYDFLIGNNIKIDFEKLEDLIKQYE